MAELRINQDLSCCGLTELSGLSTNTPEQVIRAMCMEDVTQRHTGITLFTGASPKKAKKAAYAEAFAKYITDKKLGKVTVLDTTQNRNTKNYITLYAWFVNKRAIDRWKKKDDAEIVKGKATRPEGGWDSGEYEYI